MHVPVAHQRTQVELEPGSRGGGDTVEVHARIAPADPPPDPDPIVLVHGLVVSSRYHRPLLRALAPRRVAIAPDLPGFGRSEHPHEPLDVPGLADALHRWLQHRGLEDAPLLGHSFGGQVVVEHAHRHPSSSNPLILADATVDPRHRDGPLEFARWLRDTLQEPPPLLTTILRDTQDAGPAWGLATFKALLEHPAWERLPHVHAPTLVVRGSRDPILPRDAAMEATRRLPLARYVEVQDAPHAVNVTHPQVLADATLAFLHHPPRDVALTPATA